MKRIPKRKRGGQHTRAPRTLTWYEALRGRSQDAAQNAAQVVTRMREGVSLKRSSAEFGIDPRSVVRFGGSALRQTESGRYVAKRSDNLLRKLVVNVYGGREAFVVRGSRAAHDLAERSAAQGYFVATGDDSKLRKLQGKRIYDASGREIPFLTDLNELERLGDAGVLSFESIYARRV